MEIDIYYEDTDCGGVVYYANYLKYFERARTRHIANLGVDLSQLMEDGYLFTVRNAEIEYLSPARYGDKLFVSTELVNVKKASFSFKHVISRASDLTIIVKGSCRLACVNNQGRPSPIPKQTLNLLKVNE